MSLPEIPLEDVGTETSSQAEGSRLAGERGLLLRLLVSFAAMAVWFWTQSLLGARTSPTATIGDGLHNLTAPLNAYFQGAPRAANALLIPRQFRIDRHDCGVSSGQLDFRRPGCVISRRNSAGHPPGDAGIGFSSASARNYLASSGIPFPAGDL